MEGSVHGAGDIARAKIIPSFAILSIFGVSENLLLMQET
jgi:hypothetical protein